jgi:hypothetical protein
MELGDIVFGNTTVQDLLIYIGIGVAAIWLFGFIRKFFRTEEESPHHRQVRCSACGWQGKVSRYAARCPKCNQPVDGGGSGPGR